MCFDDGKGRWEVEREVCVEAQAVNVEGWDLKSMDLCLEERENSRIERGSDQEQSVWREDLVLDSPARDGFGDSMSLDVGIELFEVFDCLLGAELAQRGVFEEEIDAQICLFHDSGVKDGEGADSGEDEVLERLDAGDAWAVVDEQDVALFQRDLSRGTLSSHQLPFGTSIMPRPNSNSSSSTGCGECLGDDVLEARHPPRVSAVCRTSSPWLWVCPVEEEERLLAARSPWYYVGVKDSQLCQRMSMVIIIIIVF